MSIINLPILEIALALVIAWALFAIFCSLLYEAYAQINASRGLFMKKHLCTQLNDAVNGVNWATGLYEHGSVKLLTRSPRKPTSDISPKLFAEALVDVVGKSKVAKAIPPVAGNTFTEPLLKDFNHAVLVLKHSDVLSFLQQAMQSAQMKAQSTGAPTEGLIYSYLIEELEHWFREFNERLILWYKKKARQRLFFIGLITALIINVDSAQLFTIFKKEPKSRKELILFYEKNQVALEQLADNLPSSEPIDRDSLIKLTIAYSKKVDTLVSNSDLPVGLKYNLICKKPEDGWLLKFLGLIISGFAASFGAPFWFDIIRKMYMIKK
jgi:hypothetical protein